MTGFPILHVDQIILFVLVMARLSGVFIVSPLLSNRSVPNRIKLLIVLSISFLLVPVVAHTKGLVARNHIELLAFIFEELTLGLVIGFVASLVFAAIQAAGEILGMQAGYGIATIFDPSTEVDTGVLTTLYIVLGALLFLYLDGHHLILSSAAKSFDVLPLAQGFNMKAGLTLSLLVQKLLVVALQICAPVLVVVSILNLVFGLMTKIAPQMNVYFNVGFIIGPLVGILVLILSLPLFRVLMTSMVGGLQEDLLKTIHELKGA